VTQPFLKALEEVEACLPLPLEKIFRKMAGCFDSSKKTAKKPGRPTVFLEKRNKGSGGMFQFF